MAQLSNARDAGEFRKLHLWLDWRSTAPWLGHLFADYEPGIHYSQVQMQSGTTGMNAVRIYNPLNKRLTTTLLANLSGNGCRN